MRQEVIDLVALGPLPSDMDDNSDETIYAYENSIEAIIPPVTDEEAAALCAVFGNHEDSCFGLAWSLLHLIETAPTWNADQLPPDNTSPWFERLRKRLANYRLYYGDEACEEGK